MAAARSEQGFWEEFLGLYRSHPCLWDARSESYSDKHMKDRAYALLVRKCRQRHPEATREFVAKKIHNFRCGYRRELKKVRDSPRNGSGEPSYSPSLWYFDKLHFIEGSSDPAAPSLLGVDFEEEEEEANELVKSDPDIAMSDLDSTEGGAATPFRHSTPELSLPLPFCELPSPEPSLSSAGGGGGKDLHRAWKKSEERLLFLADSPPRPKRRASAATKKRSRPRKRSRHRSPAPVVVPAVAATVTTNDDDDCDVAGKKLAFDLRKMSEPQRCIAEKLVNEVVFYGKLGKLNENCSFSVTPENIMPLTLYYNMQHHYYQREPTVYDHKALMQMANNS